jgi:hypothetical protein
MRRAVLLLGLGLCLAAAGCGSSSSSSPLGTELSYFPDGGPFVATIATDPNGTAIRNLKALLGAFPFSQLALGLVESQLTKVGLNYQTDVEPLYGNPVAFGVLHIPGRVSVSGSHFLAVWVTKSAAKLAALIKKLPNATTASRRVDGATLYQRGSTAIAIDGATVVLGATAADVAAALDRHAHGGGITASAFATAMGNLPRDSLIEAFGTLSGVLAAPAAAAAHKLAWIAAIRTYAAAISAGASGLTARFRVDTSSGHLTGTELPIAGGTAAPGLAGTLPVVVGLRDPAQSINFVLAALQNVDPRAYSQFARAENILRARTGYDVETFAALLTGNTIVETDTRTTMGRADVSDPASAARQLALLPALARSIKGVRAVKRRPGGFYAIERSKGRPLDVGLVGNQVVAGVATPAQLRAFAAAPATPAPGATGAIAARVDLLGLLRLFLRSPSGSVVHSALSTLGNITGSAAASPEALTAALGLALK